MGSSAFSDIGLKRQSGSAWAHHRTRSSGVLTTEQIDWCRANEIDLGYDPVQHGLVPLNCIDDIIGDQSSDRTVSDRTEPAPVDFSAMSLVFRRWQEADAPHFAALLGNDIVWRYLPDTRPAGLDLTKASELIRFSNEAEHHDVFAVEIAGKIVGQARLLFDMSRATHETAEISYWLGEQYWGRGLGSRIVKDFTAASFSRWPSLSTIVARVHLENKASQLVLTKAGYSAAADGSDPVWRLYQISRT